MPSRPKFKGVVTNPGGSFGSGPNLGTGTAGQMGNTPGSPNPVGTPAVPNPYANLSELTPHYDMTGGLVGSPWYAATDEERAALAALSRPDAAYLDQWYQPGNGVYTTPDGGIITSPVGADVPGATFRGMVGPDGRLIPFSLADYNRPRNTDQGGAPMANIPADAVVPGLDPEDTLWTQDPLAAYMKHYGINALGRTPYEEWLMDQYNPTYATFQAGNRGQPGVGFKGFLDTVGPLNAQNKAAELFSNLTGPATTVEEQTQQYLSNRQLQDLMKGNFRYFLQNVFRNKMGQFWAPYLTSDMQAQQAEYQGWAGAANKQTSFLDYLREKYGL